MERKNGWQWAEHAGSAHPRGMQRVLARSALDADAVRDDLRADGVAALGEPDAMLVLDETGFPTRIPHAVGVARQYCGTLGTIAHCQVGVFLGYASPRGHAGIDRALFVPREWVADPRRCQAAGLPEMPHCTKPHVGSERQKKRASPAPGTSPSPSLKSVA